MAAQWEYYLCEIDGDPASIMVDLGLRNEAPIQGLGWLQVIAVDLRNPSENGLSTDQEFPVLSALGESLIQTMQNDAGARYAGRVTGSGKREFLFYCPDAEGHERRVQEALREFEGYSHRLKGLEDPGWTAYRDFLLPSPEEFDGIQNRRVLESLREAGDPLSVPRPVSHWAYFQTEEARASFAEAVERSGYQVGRDSLLGADSKGSFGIQFRRVEDMNLSSLNAVTAELRQMCRIMNGEYDGWETEVLGDSGEGTPEERPD